MSQITCCPTCGTHFKVVPDQLRLSEGWVRCGHCQALFDAIAHLEGASAPKLPDSSPQTYATAQVTDRPDVEMSAAAVSPPSDAVAGPGSPLVSETEAEAETPAMALKLPPARPQPESEAPLVIEPLVAEELQEEAPAPPAPPVPEASYASPASAKGLPMADQSTRLDAVLPAGAMAGVSEAAAQSSTPESAAEDPADYAMLDPDALQWPEPEELGIQRETQDFSLIVDTTRVSEDPDDPDIPALGIPAYRPERVVPERTPPAVANEVSKSATDWDAVAADLERAPVQPPSPRDTDEDQPQSTLSKWAPAAAGAAAAAATVRTDMSAAPSARTADIRSNAPAAQEPAFEVDVPPPAVPAGGAVPPRSTEAAEGSKDDMVDLQVPSFIRKAQRQAFWRQGWVRELLVTLAVLQSVLLAAQWAVHQRDRLAVSQPQWKPMLEQLCQWWQCDIEAPKEIEYVTVESSSFQKRRDGAYAVELTLANRSASEVAFPAVELSLTDSSERTVLRRVILASQWPQPTPSTLAARAEWMGQLQIQLAPEDAALVSGYRALIFYP